MLISYKGNNMKNPLTIHSDSSESLHYNLDNFPLYTHLDELYNYDYKAMVHWHPDLEFIYIVKGTMDYFVNGKTITINQGDAIFVNSQRLHYGFSNQKNDCTFIALVISPRLFVNITESCEQYFNRKFGIKNTDYIPLYSHVPWEKEVINQIITIHKLMHINPFNPVHVLSLCMDIIYRIGEHIDDYQENILDTRDQISFLGMITYIEKNYGQEISLMKLSSHVGISRNKCCELFKRFTNDTPNNYIIHYRINKSIELLKNTHLTISEISSICGFSTPSYFSNVFYKIKGCSPKEVRH